LGLIPFAWLYFRILKKSYLNSKRRTSSPFDRGLAFGLFAGTWALLVHACFVNSLLFPQIMIPFWILTGLATVTENISR
jgi:hypothetical protein